MYSECIQNHSLYTDLYTRCIQIFNVCIQDVYMMIRASKKTIEALKALKKDKQSLEDVLIKLIESQNQLEPVKMPEIEAPPQRVKEESLKILSKPETNQIEEESELSKKGILVKDIIDITDDRIILEKNGGTWFYKYKATEIKLEILQLLFDRKSQGWEVLGQGYFQRGQGKELKLIEIKV